MTIIIFYDYYLTCRTRFILGTHHIIDSKIINNSLKLPKDTDEVQVEKPRINVNDRMLNKLRGVCEVRPSLAKQVFQGEWTGLPECFVTKDCSPYHNTKSVIINCITTEVLPSSPKVEAIVVDLSLITVGSGINGGVGIILSWVENLGFSRPKRKICITDGKIKVEKLISGGDGYSGPKSKYVTESPAIQPVNGQPSLFYCIPCQKNLIKLNRYSCGERTSI